MSVPKEIREDLARAKAYLQDDAIIRALELLSSTLRNINSLPHIPSGNEMDKQINSTLKAISKHPHMQIILQHYVGEKKYSLTYKRGKEKILATVLKEFIKMLQTPDKEADLLAKELEDKRLAELLNKARKAFSKGEIGIAASFLQRAAAEFDTNSTVLNHIGNILARTKQYNAAAKVFQQNIKCAPRNMENYTQAINNFILAEKYSKAERIFTLALRQFGAHPRTYGRMAALYLEWEKYSEAKEFSRMALKLDPEEEYALQVLKKLKEKASLKSKK